MILSKSGERWCVGLIHLRPSTRRQQPSLPSNHAPQPSAPRHLTLLRPHTAILCIRSARQVPIGPSLQPHAPAEEFHPTARAAPLCSAVAACTCTALSPHRQTQTTKRTIDAAVFLQPRQVTISAVSTWRCSLSAAWTSHPFPRQVSGCLYACLTISSPRTDRAVVCTDTPPATQKCSYTGDTYQYYFGETWGGHVDSIVVRGQQKVGRSIDRPVVQYCASMKIVTG